MSDFTYREMCRNAQSLIDEIADALAADFSVTVEQTYTAGVRVLAPRIEDDGRITVAVRLDLTDQLGRVDT